MAESIRNICILVIVTMVGPMIVNAPSALTNIAMLQCNLHKSVGASSELALQLSTNSGSEANFNSMFICITEPFVCVTNKINVPYVPMSFISYVHGKCIKPSFCVSASTSSWPCAAICAQLDLLSYYVPK